MVIQTAETASTRKATDILVKILDITYLKEELKQVAANATHLNAEEITLLIRPLKDFDNLFYGNLGYWDTEPIDLEINPVSKPLNSKCYPFPRINKENFHKELKLLLEIGFITPLQNSQYGNPVFIIPKKEGTVRFIKDYRRINQKLVRNPYPLPRIGETMQQLEGFQYATALYLKIGYYTIGLFPASQHMTTIINEFLNSDTIASLWAYVLWDISSNPK